MAQIIETKFIWMDGKFVSWKDAKVHAMTHALHYGSAVFEGIRSYKTGTGAAISRADDHLKRLFFSADVMGIKIKYPMKKVKGVIAKLLKMNKLENAYIRPLAYYGYGAIGVFPKNAESSLMILALPDYAKETKPLQITVSKFTRPSEKSTVIGAKISGFYANSILAMKEAREKGYDEALMLDGQGFVSEGPAQNMFIIKNKTLISPCNKSALPGFTRDTIFRIGKDIGLRTAEKNLSVKEVLNSDEAFFCGTGIELLQVISIDGKKINNGKPGKFTAMIKDYYFDIVSGKNKKYNKWLSYV